MLLILHQFIKTTKFLTLNSKTMEKNIETNKNWEFLIDELKIEQIQKEGNKKHST